MNCVKCDGELEQKTKRVGVYSVDVYYCPDKACVAYRLHQEPEK